MPCRSRPRAEADGDDYIIKGGKHFITGVGMPDFAIVFTVTGVDETKRGPRKRITAFLVDQRHAGLHHPPRPALRLLPRL